MDQVQIIENSLRCFGWGMVGLLPVVGLPGNVMALLWHFRVRRHTGARWNPAKAWLKAGGFAGGWGLLLNSAALIGLFCLISYGCFDDFLSRVWPY